MSQPTTLDIEFVRHHFPGLNDWAFFENAGGTFVPQSVIDRIRDYMTDTQVQPGGDYAASILASERIAESQRLMAEMINAVPEEIIIGPSSTMNVYVLAHALRSWFKPGDELVVTNLDHETNIGAWRRLAELGVVIKEWQLHPDTAELEVERLKGLLTERTRLVCFTYCSNITGSIHDVRAITRLVHDAGALACVDAVAYAPHRSLDVKALDVDFCIFSTYKLYGPHLAILYGKRGHLLEARGQNHFFIGEPDIPLKLNPGGVNHELTAALTGIVEYFDAIHRHQFPGRSVGLHQRMREVFGLVADHEETLADRFIDFLKARPNVRLIGRATADKTRRAPTFSFIVEGRDSSEFPVRLAKHGVAIRSGHFYAARCIEALGLGPQNGVVRASMVHYNTPAEVDRLIERLDEAL
ncbi:MAG: cysteine desulfurase-like protein [Gammaproteobacteria bacterium]|nr:MAG: cysteine desulfurase-like protein [Gammaproteobacteria bacterium]